MLILLPDNGNVFKLKNWALIYLVALAEYPRQFDLKINDNVTIKVASVWMLESPSLLSPHSSHASRNCNHLEHPQYLVTSSLPIIQRRPVTISCFYFISGTFSYDNRTKVVAELALALFNSVPLKFLICCFREWFNNVSYSKTILPT